ncbi:MAG TPA: tyrosine-type recombinase/integrase [Candidatus Udaeobacter sp.]|jgi:integrase
MKAIVSSEDAVDQRKKNFLTETETTQILVAARKGRHGIRNYLLLLMAYRHGLRVSELLAIRISDLDLDAGRVFVRRTKNGLSTNQPLKGDEIRAIRAWLRKRRVSNSPLLFLSERGPMTRQAFNYLCEEIGKRASLPLKIHPHMLRHSCGFALANKGCDTRLIQDYLGHRNIRHTQIYTRTAAVRFEGLWR